MTPTTSNEPPKILDVVALVVDRPSDNLRRGQVGTVVEVHSADTVEVEFVDQSGRTYALLPLSIRDVLVLRYAPIKAA